MNRDLMGKIVDEVFGGAIEDASVIEEIYAVIKREEAAQPVQADEDETYEIGKRDGYSEAVQQIDQLTGGDGEYRYCLGFEDSVRHTPGPAEMIQRIVDRFETLNLLTEATDTGSDQPDDSSPTKGAGADGGSGS